jgi:hypothetical protein
MGRFILTFLLLVGAALVSVNGIGFLAEIPLSLDLGGVGTQVEGRSVVRRADRVEARFTKIGSLEESYMLFGGDASQRANQINHASFAGLPTHDARAIASRYPDFYMCKSPGAKWAQDRTEAMSIIAGNREAVRTLERALALFNERLQAGGERTCVRVKGAPLSLDSVELDLGEQREDVTAKFQQMAAQTSFVLAESVEIEDCQTLLR